MKDIPIIFSAPMVLALLDGRKTMTRRLAWKDVTVDVTSARPMPRAAVVRNETEVVVPTPWQRVEVGDRLWVRESLQCFNRATAQYVADISPVAAVDAVDRAIDGRAKWTWKQAKLPSIHMPRWASRLTLVVTAKKIERLQAMREAECIAEGCKVIQLDRNPVDDGPMVRLGPKHVYGTPRTWFRELWDSLHGAGSWDKNPEVVALSFTVHKQNIDSMKEAA